MNSFHSSSTALLFALTASIMSPAEAIAQSSGQSGPAPTSATNSAPSISADPYAEGDVTEGQRDGAKAYSEADKALAARPFAEAMKLKNQERWAEAYPLFVAAWERYRSWKIALNMGHTELELGKFHLAEVHLSFAQGAAELPATDRPEVARMLGRAIAGQGTLQVQATAQTRARLFLDGELVGTTPFDGTMRVDPGEHTLELRLGSARTEEKTTAMAGEVRSVRLELRGMEGLYVAPPPVPPKKSPDVVGPSWVAALPLAGLAVAGIMAGAVVWASSEKAGAVARRTFAELPAIPGGSCPLSACIKVDEYYRYQADLQTAAVVTWGLAGAAAAGAALVWVVTERDTAAPRRPPTVTPAVSTRGAGLILSGSF